MPTRLRCYLGSLRRCGFTRTGFGPGFEPGPGQAGVLGVLRRCGFTGTDLRGILSFSSKGYGSGLEWGSGKQVPDHPRSAPTGVGLLLREALVVELAR